METIPIHLLSSYLDKKSKQACYATHAMFSEVLVDDTYYDGWHVIDPNLMFKYRALKKRMPNIKKIKLYITQQTPQTPYLIHEILVLSQLIKLELDIRQNANFITALLVFVPDVEIKYLNVNFFVTAQLLYHYAPSEVVLVESNEYPLTMVTKAKYFKHIQHFVLMDFCHLHVTQQTIDEINQIPAVYIHHRQHAIPPTLLFTAATMIGNMNCDEKPLPLQYVLEYAKYHRLKSYEINTGNMWQIVNDPHFKIFINEAPRDFEVYLGCNALLCVYSIPFAKQFLTNHPERKVHILPHTGYEIIDLREQLNIEATSFLLYKALESHRNQITIYAMPSYPVEHYLNQMESTPHLHETWKMIFPL